MDLKTKNFILEIKATDVKDTGEFTGYGSVFGVTDLGLDVIEKGAFRKTLKERKPKLLWQHKMHEPIGVFKEIKEDRNGLFVHGLLNMEVQRAKEAHSLMRQGALDGLSIGYTAVRDEYERETGIRRLKEVKLYEVSLVTFPMNEEATVSAVKSATDDLTEEQKEEVLRFIQALRSATPQNDSLDASVGAEEEKDATVEEHLADADAATKDGTPLEQAPTITEEEIKNLVSALKKLTNTK